MWKNRSTSAAPSSSSFALPTTTSAALDESQQQGQQHDSADLNSLFSESVSRRRSLVSSITSFTRSKKTKSALRFAFDPAPIKESEQEREERDTSSMRSKSVLTIAPSSSAAAPNSEPLLTLLLSSTSFLDTMITDEGKNLYVIDTRASRTSVCREEPVKGIVHCGAIHWVQENAVDRTLGIVQETTVHMAGGRKMNVREFLKSTAFSSSTKQFSVPNFPYVLKWKRTSQLLTLSVAKGKEKTTVATLEPAILEAPPRIRIFDPLYEPDPTRPLKEHRGIPTLLLDYLIASAILMCADKHEWLQAAQQPATGLPPKEERETQNLIQQWRHHVESVAVEENILVPSRARPGSSVSAGSSTSVVDVSMESVYGHGRANNTLETPRVSDRRSLDLSSPSTNSHPSTIFTSFSGVAHPYAATFLDENSSPASEFGQSVYSGFQSDGRVDDITPRGATHPIHRNSGHGRGASTDARSEPDNTTRRRYAPSMMSTAASTMSSPAPGSSSRRRPLPTIPTGGPGIPPVPNIPPELMARLNLDQRASGLGMSEFGEPDAPMDFLQNNSLGISQPASFSFSMSPHSSPLYGSYAASPASESPPNVRPRMQTLGSSSEGLTTRHGQSPNDTEPRRRTTSENAATLMSAPQSQWAGDGALQQQPLGRGSGTSTPTLPAGAAPGQPQQGEDGDEEPVVGSAPSGTTRLQHRMSMYKGPRPGDEDAEVEQGGEASVVHANAVDAGLVQESMVHPLRLRSGDSSRARPSTAASSSSVYSSLTMGPLTAASSSTFGGQLGLGRAGAVLEDDEFEGDLDQDDIHDAEFAPPSYDSIDFSRPPVKPDQGLRLRQ